MFGILTGWLNEWVKMGYLSTTEDVLNCFQQNNTMLPFPTQNFFWKISIALFGPLLVCHCSLSNYFLYLSPHARAFFSK
jgi:hypothetical protein